MLPTNDNNVDGVTVVTIISCAATIIIIAFLIFVRFQYEKYGTSVLTPWVKPAPKPIVTVDPFNGIKLEAKSAYVYDARDGKPLFAKNATSTLPLASLTKIMTAMTALKEVPKSHTVVITANDIEQDGDSGLYAGESWSLERLLQFTLLVSSNDGAEAVADSVGASMQSTNQNSVQTPVETFVANMNKGALKNGFIGMHFNNPTGLDVSTTVAGGYGSAHDIALLFTNANKTYPDIFGATQYSADSILSESGFTHEGSNTNDIVQKITGLRASKTGYTDLAGGNLVIEFDVEPTHPIVAVVLGSSYDGRFTDMEKLVEATYNDYK